MAQCEEYLEANGPRFLQEFLDFLSIPSISALPQHQGDVQRAAEWLVGRLQAAGVEGARVLPTGAQPVVYGEWLHAPGHPTALVYGHYDVQPADPLHLWTTPPFQPTVREGRIYARGASDMKNGIAQTINAVEALLRVHGRLPINVKFFLEGQEEMGSPQAPAFVAANKELLACDLILNADSSQWGESEPALLVGLRGICALEIEVQGANTDLHSGLYGGAVANPLHALAEIIASCHAPDGRIAVEGFYDDVAPLSEADRQRIAAVPFSEDEYRAELGLETTFGEPGYSTLERQWARPTLDVNGMWGGFQGEGIKTVLAREAHAKLSCRLVPNQDPDKILALLERHIAAHTQPGVRVTLRPEEGRVRAYVVPVDHFGTQAARDVLKQLYGKEPYYIRMGGSVPILDVFLRELGAYSIPFGFGLPDEKVHAPDEFFRVSSFEKGQVAYVRLLQRLGQA
ncbi:MAG: dipeptidase [Chloroflexota bacterium]